MGEVYGARDTRLGREVDRKVLAEDVASSPERLAPQRITSRHLVSLILANEGRDAEAVAATKLEPAEWARLTSLAAIHHMAGRKAESDDPLRLLEAKYGHDCALQIAAVCSS
jgi:hypothetical protein